MPVDRENYYFDLLRGKGPAYAGFELAASESVLNLMFTYDWLHQCTAKYMADYGLSKSAFNVLMLLRHGPAEGMQLHDLGELLLVSRANITGLISHLEEKGYVTREVDEQDRRARYARVTPKAESLLAEFIPIHYGNVGRLMSDLTNGEKKQLTELLTKMRMSIKNHSGACEKPVEAKV